MKELESAGKLVYSKSGMGYEKRYLDESKGIPLQDIWTDIPMLRGIHTSGERLGYPTQKPDALLQRILTTSSNEGECSIRSVAVEQVLLLRNALTATGSESTSRTWRTFTATE